MVIKKTTKNIAQKIAQNFINQAQTVLPIDMAYLFGSYAANRQKDWSDIDVAIFSNSIKNRFSMALKLGKIDANKYSMIEPHVFKTSDWKNNAFPVIEEIKKHGIKIHV